MRPPRRACSAALLLLSAACRTSDPPPPPAPAASASALAVAAPASASAAPPGSTDPCSQNPSACAAPPGPYTPPAEVPAAPAASAAPAPAASAASAASARRPLGTIADWVKAYEGGGAPEDKKPPRLGLLADLHDLPKSTLLYVRSGQLRRVELPSGAETPLAPGPGSIRQPRFTRDGRAIFFVSNREGSVDKVFRMNADGGGIAAVTKGIRARFKLDWAVADDGARVAYVPSSGDENNELHLVDVASGKDDVIRSEAGLSYPSFSRDGKTLFFVQGWLEAPAITATHPCLLGSLDLATRQVKLLPNAGVAELTSPWDLGDGRLLFVASVDFSMAGRSPNLQTMAVTGGAWSRLGSFTRPIGYISPEPSPDRKQMAIAWSARQGGFGADWFADVSVTPLEGGPERALTGDFPRPFYGAASPSWAPDSRHLAFVLTLCPYAGCETTVRSVVIVDTQAPAPRLAFVGYGGSPSFAPAAP